MPSLQPVLNRLFTLCQKPLTLVILTVAICIPTLPSGLFGDDLVHRQIVAAFNEQNSPLQSFLKTCLHLFNFTGEQYAQITGIEKFGAIPWWTHPETESAFWRPLSAATHWVDYTLWPESAWVMHLHTGLYFAAIIAMLWLLLKSFLNGLPNPNDATTLSDQPNPKIVFTILAPLLIIFFLLDFSHLFPFFWVANRNIILALFFCCVALYCHHLWRQQQKLDHLASAMVALFMSLLSAEGGLATTAYLFAYAIAVEKSSLWRRLFSLLPYLFVIIAWRWIYYRLGFGDANNGLYIDPIGSPELFISNLIVHWPILFFGNITALDTYHLTLAPIWKTTFAWACLILSIYFVYLTRRTLERYPLAQFGLIGLSISLIPICAMSVPGGRLFFFASLGTAFYLSHVIVDWYQQLSDEKSWLMRLYKLRFSVLVGVHLVLMVPLIALISLVGAINGAGGLHKSADFSSWINDGTETLVIVNAPNPFSTIYTPSHFNSRQEKYPLRIIQLSPGYSSMTLKKITHKDFLLTAETPFLFERTALLNFTTPNAPTHHISHFLRAMNTIFTADQRQWLEGQIVRTPFADIKVSGLTNTDESQQLPIKLRIEFSDFTKIDDAIWLYWDWENSQYVRIKKMSRGEKLKINGPY